jgi:hypothetical protein
LDFQRVRVVGLFLERDAELRPAFRRLQDFAHGAPERGLALGYGIASVVFDVNAYGFAARCDRIEVERDDPGYALIHRLAAWINSAQGKIKWSSE